METYLIESSRVVSSAGRFASCWEVPFSGFAFPTSPLLLLVLQLLFFGGVWCIKQVSIEHKRVSSTLVCMALRVWDLSQKERREEREGEGRRQGGGETVYATDNRSFDRKDRTKGDSPPLSFPSSFPLRLPLFFLLKSTHIHQSTHPSSPFLVPSPIKVEYSSAKEKAFPTSKYPFFLLDKKRTFSHFHLCEKRN